MTYSTNDDICLDNQNDRLHSFVHPSKIYIPNLNLIQEICMEMNHLKRNILSNHKLDIDN